MKYLVLSILLLFSSFCFSQTGSGDFCFDFTWPTQTVDGSDASTVGLSAVYFEIYQASSDTRRSVYIEDQAIIQHCFSGVPVGDYQFAHRAYDAIGCQGATSDITTHTVLELREALSVPVTTVNIVGSQPTLDADKAACTGPECEIRP